MADELVKVAEDSARGGLFLIVGTALSTVIMAVSSILIGWFLGAEQYGRYTVALIMPQFLFLLADFGINQGITKFSASLSTKGETNRLLRIIRDAILLKALVGLGLFAVNYVFADQFAIVLDRPDLGFEVRIAAISLLFQVVFAVTTSAFVGLDKTEFNVLTTNVQALAKTIISIVLVLLGLGVVGALIGFVASYVAAAAVSAPLLLLLLRKRQAPESDSSIVDNLKILLGYGSWLYISLLLTGCIPIFQNFVLAHFTTDMDVGNYKTATNFATLMTILSFPITTMLLPAFAKLDISATDKIKTFFRLANKYTTMLVIPATVFMIAYASEIVHIVYQSKFEAAPAYLATYCLLFFLVGLGYLTVVSLFNGLGQTRLTLTISLVLFLTLLVLSPILTSTFGVQGLITAFLIASTACTVSGLYLARMRFQVTLGASSLVKIYLAAVLAIVPSAALLYTGVIRGFVSAVSPSFLLHFGFLPELVDFAIGGILYVLIYLAMVPLAGIMTDPELQTVSRITKRIHFLGSVVAPVLKYMKRILNWKTRI